MGCRGNLSGRVFKDVRNYLVTGPGKVEAIDPIIRVHGDACLNKTAEKILNLSPKNIENMDNKQLRTFKTHNIDITNEQKIILSLFSP